jgi:hypothetical protein
VSDPQLVHRTWDALRRSDLAVEAAFAPDAKWRAVEDGPHNCDSRAEILEAMKDSIAGGLSGRIEEVFDVAGRTVVAFRPTDDRARAWPLDHGMRYVVLSLRGGLITEMKGCADRRAALLYAEAPG